MQCATASSGDGVGKADGAHSSAGGDNEAEKGLDGVSPIRTGDLGDVGWGEGSVWEVLFDHDASSGRMTVARGVRSGSAKPDARVERMETAAIRINFIIGRR